MVGRPPRPRRSPLLVFGAALTLTLGTSVLLARAGRERAEQRYRNAIQAASDRLAARLDAYEAVLYGARGLFVGSAEVSRDDFARFVAQLQLTRQFPGTRGLGYSRWLDRPIAEGGTGAGGDSVALARVLARGGSRAPRPWPAGPRAEHHAIAFLEPLDEANRAALGFDMHSEPVRRSAMDRARDGGAPAASGLVFLKQERVARAPLPGFLIYLPVYGPGPEPTTVAERRARLRGHVYAAFRAHDLLEGIFGTEDEPRVAFRIFDPAETGGPTPPDGVAADTVGGRIAPADTAPDRLLADSRQLAGARPGADGEDVGDAWTEVRRLDVFGQRWVLVFRPSRAIEVETGLGPALALALVGTLLSLALGRMTAAEVRARQRAEHADALRGRFFAAMSHELRTPINAILGYNDLLLAGVYGPLAGQQADGLARAQRAARHLLELVNDVLDLSKLEAGKVEVEMEPVRLEGFLDDLLATIRPMAEARGCPLVLHAPACHVTVRTDPRRLRQVLLNLLSNATKFGAGRPVEVRCAVMTPDAAPLPAGAPVGRAHRLGGDGVVIAVTDHGPGIAARDQDRIFEEFVQLPGSSPGGTGLGLPITRRLAELLGGGLWVRSAEGDGSTFSVVLPLDGRAPAGDDASPLVPAGTPDEDAGAEVVGRGDTGDTADAAGTAGASARAPGHDD